MLYESLLQVIDDGCGGSCGVNHVWEFYEDSPEVSEDEANAQRLDFARAVIARFRTLKTTDLDQQSNDRR